MTVGDGPPNPAVEEEKQLPDVTEEIVKTLSAEVLYIPLLLSSGVDVRHGKNMRCNTRTQATKHTHQENSMKQLISTQKQSCATPTQYSTLTELHVLPYFPQHFF